MCETAGRRCPSSHAEARRLRRHMERRQSLYLTGTTGGSSNQKYDNPEDQQMHENIHETMARLMADSEAREARQRELEEHNKKIQARKRASGRSQSNAGAYSLSDDELANLYG